jgi:hypothetical protein
MHQIQGASRYGHFRHATSSESEHILKLHSNPCIYLVGAVLEDFMQITFADGTKIEVKESALDDFLRYDLKWVEFVHGSAHVSINTLEKSRSLSGRQISASVKRCPPASLGGC